MTDLPLLDEPRRVNPGKWRDAKGAEWISCTYLGRNYDLGASWGNWARFASYWRKKKSRLRPGEKALRSAYAPYGEIPWHRRPVTVLREEDVQCILRGDESDPHKPGAGQPRHRPNSLHDLRQSKSILLSILVQEPKLKLVVLEEARRRGVSRRMAYRAAGELKVRRVWSKEKGPAFWCLPHQNPSVTSPYDKSALFLRSLLRNGPLTSKEIMREGKAAGFSRKQIHMGRVTAGVLFTRMRRQGARDVGWWHLPDQRPDQPSCMSSAESRTTSRERSEIPLPQVAYPVYIVQPEGLPIPVIFAMPSPGDAPLATLKAKERGLEVPRWDETASKLFWKGEVIREFRRHPAYNQREMFEKFQQLNWLRSIANPFPNNPRKLQQTVSDVMEKLPSQTIRFRCDGMDRVLWEEAE